MRDSCDLWKPHKRIEQYDTRAQLQLDLHCTLHDKLRHSFCTKRCEHALDLRFKVQSQMPEH